MPAVAKSLLVVAMLSTAASIGCSERSAAASSDVADASSALAAIDGGEPEDAGSLKDDFEDTAMPASTGEDLEKRMRHLLEAIVHNNPELAADALFPRDAYVAMKDTIDPLKTWDRKVASNFQRAVQRWHKQLKGVERARFISFELGHSIVQVPPKKKDFKKPLWRMKHAKLTFSIDGKVRSIDVAEMTAWRGAWYVTRLR